MALLVEYLQILPVHLYVYEEKKTQIEREKEFGRKYLKMVLLVEYLQILPVHLYVYEKKHKLRGKKNLAVNMNMVLLVEYLQILPVHLYVYEEEKNTN